MDRTSLIAEIMTVIYAAFQLGIELNRRKLATVLVLVKYLLGEREISESLEILRIYNDGLESASINNAIGLLIDMGDLREKPNGNLVLTERGKLVMSHVLSSKKRIKMWKVARAILKYNTKSLVSFAVYVLLSEDSREENENALSKYIIREYDEVPI
ncbi:MAG: hypothetical protein ACTSUJ_07905 [Candidatus Njordarchaeales archaeon]